MILGEDCVQNVSDVSEWAFGVILGAVRNFPHPPKTGQFLASLSSNQNRPSAWAHYRKTYLPLTANPTVFFGESCFFCLLRCFLPSTKTGSPTVILWLAIQLTCQPIYFSLKRNNGIFYLFMLWVSRIVQRTSDIVINLIKNRIRLSELFMPWKYFHYGVLLVRLILSVWQGLSLLCFTAMLYSLILFLYSHHKISKLKASACNTLSVPLM